MKPPVRIAVTGAAGQIAYALLPRIAAGDMLGPDQPVILQLLEIAPAMAALEGVAMELEDGAYGLLHGITLSSQAEEAFDDIDIAMLVGAKPRGPGMERKDLLEGNARIFIEQGKALDNSASKSARVLVVGNPANTNALIAKNNAPSLNPANFTAMTRLDHNRAMAMLAQKCSVLSRDVSKVAIWGNHSSTQYPDIHHAEVNGQAAISQVDEAWYRSNMIPDVQQRGAAIIKARGASSAASAASAAIDHIRSWMLGTKEGEWVSMAVPAAGHYGIDDDIIYSYPVTCENGEYKVVEGLGLNDFSQQMMEASRQELVEERTAVQGLF